MKCKMNCSRGTGSRRTNEIKDTGSASLHTELIQDDEQCWPYNYCSTSADCCGDLECVDLGANGHSVTLCYDYPTSFFGEDDNDDVMSDS